MADREGRLEDRPLRIKAEVLPYDQCDIEPMLNALQNFPDPFITRYEVDGKRYIQVVKSSAHFNPHPNEKQSEFPKCSKKLQPKTEALAKSNRALALNPLSLNPESPLIESPLSDSAVRTLSPKVEIERREYRIPEPKDDPTAAIVMYYKAVKKGIPFDDRTWDQEHWSRTARASKALLKICGSYEAARACLDQVGEQMGERSWTLETINKWAHEWKAKQGGKDYGATNSARFFDAVAKQRTAAKFAQLREKSTDGTLLDRVRNMQGISADPEAGGRGPGSADGKDMGALRADSLETEADRREEL
jgi:hypothetical protein